MAEPVDTSAIRKALFALAIRATTDNPAQIREVVKDLEKIRQVLVEREGDTPAAQPAESLGWGAWALLSEASNSDAPGIQLNGVNRALTLLELAIAHAEAKS